MALSVFSSPLLVGFDHLERTLESLSKSANDGYPPYNIEQIDSSHWALSIAVAGFAEDELNIAVEDNQLVIRGKQEGDGEKLRNYLHRGIAARQFQRRFILAEGMEVDGARLERGILHIDLTRPEPSTRVREIPISAED